MEITRRSFVTNATRLGGALTLTGLLASCGEDGSDATGNTKDLEDVSYMTPFGLLASFFVLYVARREGFWSDEGLHVQVRGGQGTATAVQGVAGGAVDITTVGGLNSIQAIAGEDLPLINIGQLNQESLFSVVSPVDSPIRTPEDMLGKRIGILSAGGAIENIVLVLAGVAGDDGSSVERPIVPGGLAGFEFLNQGRIDGWVWEEPDLAILEARGEEFYKMNPDEFAPVPDMAFLVAKDALEQNRDLLRSFLTGAYRAMKFCSDPENSAAMVNHITATNPDIDPGEVKLQLPVLIDKLTASGARPLLDMDQDLWAQGQDLMAEVGLIETPAPVEALMDTSLADEVVKNEG